MLSDQTARFVKAIPGLGHFCLYPFDLDRDTPTLHDWVNRPYAQYWMLQNSTVDDVRASYARILASGHVQVYMGYLNGNAAFLLEVYDALQDPLREHYDAQPGDCGMHILVAPAQHPIRNFTWHVFTSIMDFIFTNPGTQRVVVEPDLRNEKIHVLNCRAGFEYQKVITLPHKTAHLAFCTRDQYTAAVAADASAHTVMPPSNAATYAAASAHLQPNAWRTANRQTIKKAIAEFAHELLITPVLLGNTGDWGHYILTADTPDIHYRFDAQKLHLDHWNIREASITKSDAQGTAELNALQFILEFKDSLRIPGDMLPTYLEEICSTLYARAYTLGRNAATATQLAHAGYQEIEHAMTAGHPCFVANNGRIGFNATDYRAFAPEAASPIRLVWLAGHKSRANYAGTRNVPYETLLNQELDAATQQRFNAVLTERGLPAEDYFFMPVHPWQWLNKLAYIFAPDLANGYLVYLGEAPDEYDAQQSIRTLYNSSSPLKFYTKTALSILNMGFMRGLSPYYMGSTPAITEWICTLVGNDAFLHTAGFRLLGEVATLGYRNLYYEPLGRTQAHTKMLAALWRESPWQHAGPGQRLLTMASLLHIDNAGNALLPELIKASNIDTATWVRQYLSVYLTPLVHCFYTYELAFMPHGENAILVLENNAPVKLIMKDITEEIQLFRNDENLPEKVKRVYTPTAEDVKLLCIFTDVFDCFFRFMAHVLHEHGNFAEDRFWTLVAENITHYQQTHPHLNDAFSRYDLFAPEFTRSCLNRLQLRNNKQMVDLSDPNGNLAFVGTLVNPVAAYRNVAAYSPAVS